MLQVVPSTARWPTSTGKEWCRRLEVTEREAQVVVEVAAALRSTTQAPTTGRASITCMVDSATNSTAALVSAVFRKLLTIFNKKPG